MGNFLEQALTHLCPAVVQHDGTVLVNVDQSARLVQVSQGKGDAEFHGAKGDATFQDRRVRIPRRDLRLAVFVVRRFEQPFRHGVEEKIFDLHPIGRGVRLWPMGFG